MPPPKFAITSYAMPAVHFLPAWGRKMLSLLPAPCAIQPATAKPARAKMSDLHSILILLANLGVLALNLKLYTEILKDQSQNRRADRQKG
jgi:hypothetical protein